MSARVCEGEGGMEGSVSGDAYEFQNVRHTYCTESHFIRKGATSTS